MKIAVVIFLLLIFNLAFMEALYNRMYVIKLYADLIRVENNCYHSVNGDWSKKDNTVECQNMYLVNDRLHEAKEKWGWVK